MKLYDPTRAKLRLLHDAIDCYLRLLDQFIRLPRKGNVWRLGK